MLVDRQAGRRSLQEPRKRILAAFQRLSAKVLAI
jgi:hypothetical protein